MNVGQIFVWDTRRAQGHDLRRKYHLYIGEAGWREDGQAFLFISSSNYGFDYEIYQTDYPFLTKEVSYVSCNGMVVYPEEELNRYQSVRVGMLLPNHVQELHSAIGSSDVMEAWQITLCCNALATAFT